MTPRRNWLQLALCTAILSNAVLSSSASPSKIHAIIPNDPDYPKQWHLERIHAPEAWSITRGSPDVTVAIVDSGLDPNSPEFVGRAVVGFDYLADDEDTSDDLGHGTRVAGVLAATGNNKFRSTGIDWACKIMSLRVFGWNSSPSKYKAPAIIKAVNDGAKVINNSWGADGENLREAVYTAYKHDVIVVAASGNGGEPKLGFLAIQPNVIAVGSSDTNDQRAQHSNFGRDLDMVAPVEDILVYDEEGHSELSNGTSLAAPQVSGAASLILSIRPELGPRAVEALLYSGADDIGEPGWDEETGWGRLNIRNSLMLARCATRIEELSGARRIVWEAPPNASGRVRYRIHASEDLVNWQEIPSPNIQFADLEASAIVPRAPGSRFYRVSVESTLDLTPRVLRRDGIDAPIPFGPLMAESVPPFEPDPADLERYQTAVLAAQQAEAEFLSDYYRCKFNPAKFPFLAGYTRFGPKHLFEHWGHRPYQVAQEMLTWGPEHVDDAFPASDVRQPATIALTTARDDFWIEPGPIDPGDDDPPVIPKLGDLISVDEVSETFVAYLPPDVLERFQLSDWLESIAPLPTLLP